MGNPFGYHVSFRVTHPTLSAGEIAAQLRITPKFCWTAGEARKTPNGTPLEGVHDESYCSFDIGGGDEANWPDASTSASPALHPQGSFSARSERREAP